MLCFRIVFIGISRGVPPECLISSSSSELFLSTPSPSSGNLQTTPRPICWGWNWKWYELLKSFHVWKNLFFFFDDLVGEDWVYLIGWLQNSRAFYLEIIRLDFSKAKIWYFQKLASNSHWTIFPSFMEYLLLKHTWSQASKLFEILKI